MSSYAEVHAADAIGLVGRDEAWLLDVREQHEWDAGHAPEAHHIPLGDLGLRQGEIPEEVPVLVVCHVGGRSAMVTQALADAGYEVANVAGGMVSWTRAGGVVLDSEGRPARVD